MTRAMAPVALVLGPPMLTKNKAAGYKIMDMLGVQWCPDRRNPTTVFLTRA